MLKQEMVESLLAITKALEEDDSYIQGYNDALDTVFKYAERVKDENERCKEVEPLSILRLPTRHHDIFWARIETMNRLKNYLRFIKL